MARSTLLLASALLLSLLALGAANVGPKPIDPKLKLSALNSAGDYSKVGKNANWKVFRMHIKLNNTFLDSYSGDSAQASLMQLSVMGKVIDVPTSKVVGAYNGIHTTTDDAADDDIGSVTYSVLELGASMDDTLVMVSGGNYVPSTSKNVDTEVAVVGGTGRFVGATGHFKYSDANMIEEGILTIYVPMLPNM